jgi:hypothetical protein
MKLSIGIVFGLCCLSAAALSQEKQDLLSQTEKLSQDTRAGTVRVPFISRAHGEIESDLAQLSNFVSNQKIVQTQKREWDIDPEVLSTIDVQLRVDRSNSSIEEDIKYLAMKDGLNTDTDPKTIEDEYGKRGLKLMGVFAGAYNLPFMGLKPATLIDIRDIDRPTGGQRRAEVYSFDTAPQKPLSFTIFKGDRKTGVNMDVSVRGEVSFDPQTGKILKLSFDGYGFLAGSSITICHEEIQYAYSPIGNSDQKYWLPKRAVMKIGASAESYLLTDIEYVSYEKFNLQSHMISGVEINDDSNK